jgi:hypothetical protein
VTCPDDVAVSTDAGVCNAVVTYDAATVEDNCGGDRTTVTYSADSGTTFALGETEVTATATDEYGNTASCSFTVTVEDNEAPVIHNCAADVNTDTDPGTCVAGDVVLGSPNVTDNCGVASVENDAPEDFPLGSTTVEWNVTDDAGNLAQCEQNVTVVDDEAPQVCCPPSQRVSTEKDKCYAVVTWNDALTKDNCDANPLLALVPSRYYSGKKFRPGRHRLAYTSTDAAGNEGVCHFKVKVVDRQRPQYECARRLSVVLGGRHCRGRLSLRRLVTRNSDNCSRRPKVHVSRRTFGCRDVFRPVHVWSYSQDRAGNKSRRCRTIVDVVRGRFCRCRRRRP